LLLTGVCLVGPVSIDQNHFSASKLAKLIWLTLTGQKPEKQFLARSADTSEKVMKKDLCGFSRLPPPYRTSQGFSAFSGRKA